MDNIVVPCFLTHSVVAVYIWDYIMEIA